MAKKSNVPKNQKKGSRKQTPKVSRKPAPRFGLSLASPHDVEAACSQFDPFCPAGKGAKIMDEDSQLSQAYQVRFVIPITTNASGAVKIDIGCLLKQSYRNSGTIVGNAVTVDGSWSSVPEQTSLEATFASYRIVSWGARVFSTASATTSAGLITTKVHISPTDLENITWNTLEQRYDPVNGVAATFIAKKRGSLSRLYISTDESWSTGYRFSTDSVSIWATGCSVSTTVGQIEIIYNLECIPKDNTVSARTASPAAASNSRITEAAGNAAAQLPSLYERLSSPLIKAAMRQALIYGGQAVGGVPGALMGAAVGSVRPQGLLHNTAIEVD